MQLGLTWQHNQPEGELDEWERALELRPQWTKFSVTMGNGQKHFEEETIPWCEDLARHGVRPVIDLRTGDISSFARSAPPVDWRWDLALKRFVNERLFGGFAEWAGSIVSALGGLCSHYEVWGECGCMYAGQRFFDGGTYPKMLAAVYPAIKQASPEAKVWFGGHGLNGNVNFWQYAMQQGAGGYHNYNNLHCFMHDREWGKVEELLRGMFGTIRRIEVETRGDPQRPLAMTEFGWPSHPDGGGIPFKSYVVDSVLSCSEEEQAAWLDASLKLFEEEGVRVVIIDKLRDGKGDHWGAHCGLYREDWTAKPAVEVFRAWAEKGAGTEVSF